MKTSSTTLAIVLISLGTTVAVAAQLQSKPGRSLGDNPNPVLWGGQPVKPAPPPPPRKPDPPRHDGPNDQYHHGHHNYRGYYPYRGGYYPYYCDQYYYPSVYYYPSADDLYGPVAAQRFMGMDNRAAIEPDAENLDEPAPTSRKAVERGSNARSNALAWRFISFGDAQFARQNFVEANSRYRTASRSAPQLADAWFRQGFALAAMGRYPQAVDAVKRGLRLNPDWAKADFDLQKLFGADILGKTAVLDTLAEAAEENPNDADLLFMLGVYLHFDGQGEQAAKYFDRAMQLAGDDIEHVRAFSAKKP